MFAKVYNTITRALSRSPSVQGRPEEPREGTPSSSGPESSMVSRTLRSSARKGKRTLEAEETSTTPKRRKKTAPTTEEAPAQGVESLEQVNDVGAHESDAGSILDTIAVQPRVHSPETDENVLSKEKLPIRRRASPKVAVTKTTPTAEVERVRKGTFPEEIPSSTQETEFDTPVTHRHSSVYQTPAETRAEQEVSPTPRANSTTLKRTLRSNKQGRHNEEMDERASPTGGELDAQEKGDALDVPGSLIESKHRHVLFGSEEPPETKHLLDTQDQAQHGVDNQPEGVPGIEEGESDSDEAPEEVTAASALSRSKAAEADAARAIKAQQEKEKLKRKEHGDRVSKEQEQKRKRGEKRAKKLAKLEAQEDAEDPRESLPIDIRNLPAILPDSILQAAGDRRPPTPPLVVPGKSAAEKRDEKLKRHIKFLEHGEKPIKDVKKGTLNVRVLAQENALLAPKVSKSTKNIREKWLKGRQLEQKHKSGRKKMEFKKMERRPVGGGFLRHED